MNDAKSTAIPGSEPQWSIYSGDKEHGPFSETKIEGFLKSGKLTGGMAVRRGDDEEWTRVRDVDWMSKLLPKKAPPGNDAKPSAAPIGRPQPKPAAKPAPKRPAASPGPGAIEFAGFKVRFFAALIDFAILLLPALVVTVTLSIFGSFIGRIGSMAIGIGYGAYLLSSPWQATPGKRAMKIRVINEDGSPLDIKQAAIREACKILSGIPLFAGYIMVAFMPQHTGLHDMIAKTRVIHGVTETPFPVVDDMIEKVHDLVAG